MQQSGVRVPKPLSIRHRQLGQQPRPGDRITIGDWRPAVAAQGHLAALLQTGPRAVAQRQQALSLKGSPRVVAQARQHQQLLGASAQRGFPVAPTELGERQGPQRALASVAQRVTYEEVSRALTPDNHDMLGSWLEARVGPVKEDQDYLLKKLSVEQVAAAIRAYREHRQAELEANAITIDDVASGRAQMAEIADKKIDAMMRSSRDIADFLVQQIKDGVKVAGEIRVVGDADFQRQNWEEFIHNNPSILKSEPAVIRGLQILEAAEIDHVDAFTSRRDGKIYIRHGRFNLRVAIHEAVHKYGNRAFEQHLGRFLNEGATDYIAMQVCRQIIDPEFFADGYVAEKALLMHILKSLGISDQTLFAAYFNGQATVIERKLYMAIGEDFLRHFFGARSATVAQAAFDAGIRQGPSRARHRKPSPSRALPLPH